jgi:glucokinase
MIAVDFGGTFIKVAEVRGPSIVRSLALPTPRELGPEAVLDTLATGVRSLSRDVSALGVAIPGEVDRQGRCIRLPNVPGFEGWPLAQALSDRLSGAQVVIENDATAAALGELRHGEGAGFENFLLVMLGTGVGGGLVVGGQLVRGANGFAAEIGHIPIDTAPDARLCACGHRGCVESYAGTAGLLTTYAKLGGETTTPRDVALAADAGDEAALSTFESVGEALAKMLTTAQNLLDLDAIIIGGGISAAFHLLEPSIRAGLRARAHAEPLGEVPLRVSRLGEHVGLVGAAELVTL